MLAISNTDALQYCNTSNNNLATAVNFALSGTNNNTLTVTDVTTYPAGDARKRMSVSVTDGGLKMKEGGTTAAQPATGTTAAVAAGSTVVFDLAALGLNKALGLSIAATVVSTLNKIKDGSVVNTYALSGALTMEV